MDKRAQLILTRAQELFAGTHPDETWRAGGDQTDAAVLKRQGEFLSLAEHQLLAEGVIDSVDQS